MISLCLHLVQLFLVSTVVTANEVENNLKCYGLNCGFNPDDFLNVPQIIRRHGYPSESHIVTTLDGYLLTVFRIPGSRSGKKGGPPVLLQHGLSGDSAPWVICDNNSLAFLLADEGYDVWMGNSRGTTYSKGHISLPIWSPQYWNFSWHEMGIYDLPATILHINNVTGKPGELIYIGHSMGTTESFVLSSTLPQTATNLKLIIALAPSAYETHIRTPLRYLAPFVNDLEWVSNHLGVGEFLPHSKIIDFLAMECTREKLKRICENIFFLFGGYDASELNATLIPTIMKHEPAGSSTKTYLHYLQEIRNEGKFQQYDYGPKGNMIKYGNLTPPEYNLKNINRPIYLMYAKNDIFTSSVDVQRLSKKLSNLVGMYEVPRDGFGHLDFLFGKDVYDLVYKPLIKVMKNFTIF